MRGPVDPIPVLRALVEHDCRFVVIGSVARHLRGDDVRPTDLDLVVDPAPDHRPRLVAALTEVDATIERRSGRRPVGDALHLPWDWGWRAETVHGPIDVITRFVDGSHGASPMKDATGLSLLDLAILSACEDEDARPLAPLRKTARILDRLHTNTSIGPAVAHEPMLDLCRPWVVHLPLIECHGNIGSPDDPAASPRYTEARLTPLGVAALNAERDELGPLPIALINGTMLSGGPHPPYDPGRVVAAIRAAMGDASDDDLVELVGPPAFPTGCAVEVDHRALAAGETVELRQRAQFVHLGDQVMITGFPLRTGPEVAADRLRGRLRAAAEDAGVRGLDQHTVSDLIVEMRPGTDPTAAIELLGEMWELNRTDHVRLREPMAAAIRRIADGGRDLDHRLALIEAAIRP